jgi:hypothetical protein
MDNEPTYRQHMILDQINKNDDSISKNDDDPNMKEYWVLVRSGYLKNLIPYIGPGWIFKLTEQAEEYLESINNDNILNKQ